MLGKASLIGPNVGWFILNLYTVTRGYFGGRFSLTQAIHTAYIGEHLDFR